MAQSPSYQAAQQSMAQPSVAMAQPQQIQSVQTQPTSGQLTPSLLAPPPSQPVAADGSVIFSEFQAQVFNRVEALYKTNGYLSQPLFEDSYLLSKATATWVIANVSVVGSQPDVTSLAMATYRGVLGIAAPPPTVKPITTSPVAAVTPTRFTPPTTTTTSVPQVPTSITQAPPTRGGSGTSPATPYTFNYQGLNALSGGNLSNMFSGMGSWGGLFGGNIT